MSDVKLNDTSKGILGDAHKKVGSFKEATGGGTPLAKGEKLEDHPEAHRVSQPRDEEGKFTYNSVNGKELKYGPSRGTTVPPFLRGIKLTFCQPGTKLKIEGEDGIKIKLMTIDMSVSEIVSACKKYIAAEGGFSGMGEGSSITKTGRKSASEKAAANGQIGYQDLSKTSSKTQAKVAAAQGKYNDSKDQVNSTVSNAPFTGKPGYKVEDDTLLPNGQVQRNVAQRYHQWFAAKNASAANAGAGKTSASPANNTPATTPTPQGNKQPVTPSGAPVNDGSSQSSDSTGNKTAKLSALSDNDKNNLVSEFSKIVGVSNVTFDDIVDLVNQGVIDESDLGL